MLYKRELCSKSDHNFMKRKIFSNVPGFYRCFIKTKEKERKSYYSHRNQFGVRGKILSIFCQWFWLECVVCMWVSQLFHHRHTQCSKSAVTVTYHLWIWHSFTWLWKEEERERACKAYLMFTFKKAKRTQNDAHASTEKREAEKKANEPNERVHT